MNKRLLAIIAVLLIPIFVLGYLYFSGKARKDYVPPNIKAKMEPIELNYWRVWDDSDAFADIIEEFKQRHPNIKINYRKLRYDEYENELIEAFATDRGPDIFSIHNTWMKKYQRKELITPMPKSITMFSPYIKEAGFKKEVAYREIVSRYNLSRLKNEFVDVVYDDVVMKRISEDKNYIDDIYGLPISMDTLAMYYNRDLFNNAALTNPPKYWNREFQQNVKKMTKQNNKGEIMQSGVALGGSSNIERAVDILAVLMMQNGTKMLENDTVLFSRIPDNLKNKGFNPGIDALRFYSDFSNPAKEVYSWNSSLDNSLDLFMQGKVAMMFSYSYVLPTIKAGAPKLNYSIAPLPQIEGNTQSINFANYWVETVSSKILTDPKNMQKGSDYAKNKMEAAWSFLQFLASEKQVKKYLEKTKKPTALRSLIDEQKDDDEIGVFVKQILTSDSWYQGANPIAAEKIINKMIEDAVGDNEKNLAEIISIGAQQVQQTIIDKK